MSQMNMEVDNTYEVGDECSVDDNNLDKNARSTNSCHNNSKFSVHDKRPGKAANTLENAAGVSLRNSSTTYIRKRG